MNELILGGFVPLQFTYTQVVEDPESVVSGIRSALGHT